MCSEGIAWGVLDRRRPKGTVSLSPCITPSNFFVRFLLVVFSFSMHRLISLFLCCHISSILFLHCLILLISRYLDLCGYLCRCVYCVLFLQLMWPGQLMRTRLIKVWAQSFVCTGPNIASRGFELDYALFLPNNSPRIHELW